MSQPIPPIAIYECADAPDHARYIACLFGTARGEMIPIATTGATPEAATRSLKGDVLCYVCSNPPNERHTYLGVVLVDGLFHFPGATAEDATRSIEAWWDSVEARQEARRLATAAEPGDERPKGSPGGPRASAVDPTTWEQVDTALRTRTYGTQSEIAAALGTTQGKVSALMVQADRIGAMRRGEMQAIFTGVRLGRGTAGRARQ